MNSSLAEPPWAGLQKRRAPRALSRACRHWQPRRVEVLNTLRAMSAQSTHRAVSHRGRDPRPLLYGACNLLLAAAYASLIAVVIPARDPLVRLLFWGLAAISGLTGAATLSQHRRARALAVAGCCALIAVAVAVIVATVASAAFLAGVYGALGRGAALLACLAVGLIVELVALVPVFQLAYLRSRAGRAAFGRE